MERSSTPLEILPSDGLAEVPSPRIPPAQPCETPILHTFEARGKHFVLNPTSGGIFELASPELTSLIGLPSDLEPEQLAGVGGLARLSLQERSELLEEYRGLLSAELATEPAPWVSNDFDDPAFPERFFDSVAHFSLIPTHQCNLRCSYCVFTGTYAGKRSHEQVDISDEVVDRAAEFVASLGANAPKVDMRIFGGEALISWRSVRHFHNRLRKAIPSSKPLFFKIATNGLLLNPRVTDYAVENDLLIQVSLDGPAEIHDRYRLSAAGQPTFARIFRHLKRLWKEAPEFFRHNLSINAIYGPPYRVEEADAWFREQEIFEHFGHRTGNFSAGHINTTGTSFFDDKGDYREQLQQTASKLRERYLDGLIRDDYDSIRFFPAAVCEKALADLALRLAKDRQDSAWEGRWRHPDCIPGELMAIDPRGVLYICIQLTDYLPIGDIWNGPDPAALHRARQAFLDRKNSGCRRCWAYRYCDLCLAKMNRGKILDQKTYGENCEKSRRNLSSTLALYTELLSRAPQAMDPLFSLYGAPAHD